MSGPCDKNLISRCLLRETTPEDRAHLRSCSACGTALEQCESTFLAYRASVRLLAGHEVTPAFHTPPFQKTPIGWHGAPIPFQFSAGWSLAVVTVLATLGLALSVPARNPARNTNEKMPVSSPQSVYVLKEDAALLDQVRADVARRVPSGMEPLLMLGSGFDERNEHGGDEIFP